MVKEAFLLCWTRSLCSSTVRRAALRVLQPMDLRVLDQKGSASLEHIAVGLVDWKTRSELDDRLSSSRSEYVRGRKCASVAAQVSCERFR